MTSPAPGWYPDPGGTAPLRWWNGEAWTTATSNGNATAAAQPAGPAAPAGPGYGMAGQPGDPGAAQPGHNPSGQPGYSANPQAGGVPGQFGAATPGQFGAATEPVGGGATAYGTKSPFDASGHSSYSQAMRQQAPRGDSLFEQNTYAMGAFIASGLSIFFAIATGFVFIIITPFVAAFYSKSRNEKLAPLAFAAAILAAVIGAVALRHRF